MSEARGLGRLGLCIGSLACATSCFSPVETSSDFQWPGHVRRDAGASIPQHDGSVAKDRADAAGPRPDASDGRTDAAVLGRADASAPGLDGGATRVEETNEACSDGIDNDDNGFTDCNDFNCCKHGIPAAGITVCTAGICGGGVRDAGTVISKDASSSTSMENDDDLCSDGIDNDGDGWIDCADFNCCKASLDGGLAARPVGVTVCDAVTCQGPGKGVENTVALCTDGNDNDGDHWVDCGDRDCCRPVGGGAPAVIVPGLTICDPVTCLGPGKPGFHSDAGMATCRATQVACGTNCCDVAVQRCNPATGLCEAQCEPDCAGKGCAEGDGCGGTCGPCPAEGCEPLEWNLGSDFSATANPNGAWTYGWTNADGSGFTLGQGYQPLTLDCWGGFQAGDGNPSVCHNGTQQTVDYGPVLGPGDTVFHPGPADQRAVIRWTAPASGTFRVQGDFQASTDIGATAVHVLRNGAALRDLDLDDGVTVPSFLETHGLLAGDRMDFTVSYGRDGVFYGDTTEVSVAIRRADWDLARDFGASCNPAGAWAYGSTGALGGFVPFAWHGVTSQSGVPAWTMAGDPEAGDTTGNVWKNTSAYGQYGVEPGHVSLHPGCVPGAVVCGTAWTVVRWTSAFDGTVSIQGAFGEGDLGTPDLDIARIRGASTAVLWHRENASTTEPFGLTATVATGDRIDFVVGDAYVSGNTPLEIAIVQLF